MKYLEKKQIIDLLHKVLERPSSEVPDVLKKEIEQIIEQVDKVKTREDEINWLSLITNLFKLSEILISHLDDI